MPDINSVNFDHLLVKNPEPPKFKEVNEIVYSTDSLKMRNSACEDASVYFTVTKNTPMTRIKISYINNFDTIIYNGKEYYVNNNYITLNKPNNVSPSIEKQIAEVNKPKLNYSAQDLRLMSAVIYSESGNQPLAGQQAVGIVVMNRKESTKFKQSTIKDVIYAPGQFHVVQYGGMSKALAMYDNGTLPKTSIEAAKYALSGNKYVNYNGKSYNISNYYYFATSVKNPKLRIAGHAFK